VDLRWIPARGAGKVGARRPNPRNCPVAVVASETASGEPRNGQLRIVGMDVAELPVPPGGVRPGHLGLIATGQVILGDITARNQYGLDSRVTETDR